MRLLTSCFPCFQPSTSSRTPTTNRRARNDRGSDFEFERLLSDDIVSLGGDSEQEDNAELMSNEQIQRITSLVQQQIMLEEETSEQSRRALDDLDFGDEEVRVTPSPSPVAPPTPQPKPVAAGLPPPRLFHPDSMEKSAMVAKSFDPPEFDTSQKGIAVPDLDLDIDLDPDFGDYEAAPGDGTVDLSIASTEDFDSFLREVKDRVYGSDDHHHALDTFPMDSS